jgi:hypothetical protein
LPPASAGVVEMMTASEDKKAKADDALQALETTSS